MGFTIFTQSGTFNPADYGLKAGDIIHIVCVGGGGGGSGCAGSSESIWKGSTGSASSFGSVVTAAGGNGGSSLSSQPKAQENSNRGQISRLDYYLSTNVGVGGSGGNGWLPGHILPPYYDPLMVLRFRYEEVASLPYTNSLIFEPIYSQHFQFIFKYVNGNNTDPYKNNANATTLPGANTGTAQVISNSGYAAVSGVPGLGYGAGGSGGVAMYSGSLRRGTGGNSGQIIHKDYKLTSTSGIAITIGNGGSGGKGDGNGGCCTGGGGARGCVAIYW